MVIWYFEQIVGSEYLTYSSLVGDKHYPHANLHIHSSLKHSQSSYAVPWSDLVRNSTYLMLRNLSRLHQDFHLTALPYPESTDAIVHTPAVSATSPDPYLHPAHAHTHLVPTPILYYTIDRSSL